MNVAPWEYGQGDWGPDTLQRAGAELGRERLMLVGAPGALRYSETPAFAKIQWGASQMPPASPALFLPAHLHQKAAMTIFSVFLKLFSFFFSEALMVHAHKTLGCVPHYIPPHSHSAAPPAK